MTDPLELVIDRSGTVRCVYSETLALASLGSVTIQRASHVEPTDNGCWTADLAPVGGPTLGPYILRSDALVAETAWLAEHWLESP